MSAIVFFVCVLRVALALRAFGGVVSVRVLGGRFRFSVEGSRQHHPTRAKQDARTFSALGP